MHGLPKRRQNKTVDVGWDGVEGMLIVTIRTQINGNSYGLERYEIKAWPAHTAQAVALRLDRLSPVDCHPAFR